METINPVPPGLTAIEVAVACYVKWKANKTEGAAQFQADLADYLWTGVVVSRPSCFGMAKVILLPKTNEPAWFVRMAVGNLRELLACLPAYLPKICFCRRNEKKIREYPLARFIELTRRGRK